MNAKRAVRRILTHSRLIGAFDPFARSVGLVLMMHRFAEFECDSSGHDSASLRANLEYLRKQRFELIGIYDLVQRLLHGRSIGKCVAFTVDDGYGDFLRVGAPAFEAYDCPVTVFLASGFLDRSCWYWWDQIEFALRKTRRANCSITTNGNSLQIDLSTADASATAFEHITSLLKSVPDAEKHAAIHRLADSLEVSLPVSAPSAYAPLTWDECRHLGSRGVTFGPHTVSHPVLSRIDASRALFEISHSWNRVRSELATAVPVFCYPQGTADAFGDRDAAIVRSLEMDAALSAIPGFVDNMAFANTGFRYSLPRYPYRENSADFRQVTSGLERAKTLIASVIARR